MPKAPFKVLFNNDTTNIESCVSPYHRVGEDFRPEMLVASIDEAAGADAHMLQPGLCWVPWWKSSILPPQEHYRWLRETYGLEPEGFGRYMLAGGDMVEVFVRRCRENGQAPFISFRMNDGHHKNYVNARPGDDIPPYAGFCLSQFYVEHPEYRLSSDTSRPNMRVHNWAIPEVREHKYAFIEELCENYDLDGFELDFTRHYSYFDCRETPREKRVATMTQFVARVRVLLDRTARPGQHRWLCVHVPCFLGWFDTAGIDLTELVAAGVEMVNLSCYYNTIQQTDLPEIRELIPQASLYHEMSFCTTVREGPGEPASKEDNGTFRRTTDEQFYTGAHLAYRQGADGVSFFNFVYYREHGTPGRGPFTEPPFHVLGRTGDPDWVARSAQHYILTDDWQMPLRPQSKLPRELAPRGPALELKLELFPPVGGWQVRGRLILQSVKSFEFDCLTVRLNGHELEATPDVSKPYPNAYDALTGPESRLRAWSVPPDVLREGTNTITIRMLTGEPTEIAFLELAMPAPDTGSPDRRQPCRTSRDHDWD